MISPVATSSTPPQSASWGLPLFVAISHQPSAISRQPSADSQQPTALKRLGAFACQAAGPLGGGWLMADGYLRCWLKGRIIGIMLNISVGDWG